MMQQRLSIKIKILCSLLCFLPVFAFASNWSLIGIGQNQTSFIDLDSVKLVEKNQRQAWFLTSYYDTQTLTGYPPYKSLKSLIRIDCKNEVMGTIRTIIYSEEDGGGTPLLTEDFILKLMPPTPDSLGESRLKSVCAAKIKK